MDKKNSIRECIKKFKNSLVIVEGEKDASSLSALGFSDIHVLHKHSSSLKEHIENLLLKASKQEEICILTDNDKEGRKLNHLIRAICSEHGFKVNTELKRAIMKEKISHIEGLYHYLLNMNNQSFLRFFMFHF